MDMFQFYKHNIIEAFHFKALNKASTLILPGHGVELQWLLESW